MVSKSAGVLLSVAIVLAVILFVSACVGGTGTSEQTAAAGHQFVPINLGELDWYIKYGFQPDDASGFDTTRTRALAIHTFPIDPLALLDIPPSSGTHQFALMTSFDLPAGNLPPLSFSTFRIGENWAVYLNGHLLRDEIRLNPDGSIRSRRSIFGPIVPIPYGTLRQGQNTLVLHLMGEARPTSLHLRHHMMIGSRGFEITTTENAYRFTWDDLIASANIVYVFFSLFYMVFYFWRPNDPHPLYFGLFTLLFALYQFTGYTVVGEIIPDTTWVHRVRWSSLALLPPLMSLFIQSFFFGSEGPKVAFRIIVIVGCAFFAWFTLAPFSWALAGVSFWQLHTILVILILSGYMVVAWHRRLLYARTMAIGIILFGLLAIFDMVAINLFVHEFRASQVGILGLVTTMALLISFRFIELYREAEQIRRVVAAQRDAFARFVPTPFLDLLGRKSAAEILLGDNTLRPMSVLFSDIRSFTRLSESMSPQENFDFLNSYLKRVEPIIEQDGGFVDKFMGDGLMALFAETDDRHKPVEARITSADRAVKAAVRMQEELNAYNANRESSGYARIQVGVGINSGDVILGTVGSASRIDTTVVGDAVNVAARLEELAGSFHLRILISEVTCRQLTHRTDHCLRKVGWIVLRGKAEAISVYEVFDCDDAESQERKLRTRALLESALEARRTERTAEAHEIILNACRQDPADPVLEKYSREWMQP